MTRRLRIAVPTTTLANCPHPVGEQMWLGVRAQPDGSYWGGHQWFRDAGCEPIPERGNTAYRVLARPDGAFLRVCFAPPESPDVQPKIEQIATLPRQGRRRCLSRRSFRIRLKEPRGDALRSAEVFVNGRSVEVRRGERLTAPINLRGLPRGRYTVKIVAKTVLGKTIQGKRRYRTCAQRRRGSGGGPL